MNTPTPPDSAPQVSEEARKAAEQIYTLVMKRQVGSALEAAVNALIDNNVKCELEVLHSDQPIQSTIDAIAAAITASTRQVVEERDAAIGREQDCRQIIDTYVDEARCWDKERDSLLADKRRLGAVRDELLAFANLIRDNAQNIELKLSNGVQIIDRARAAIDAALAPEDGAAKEKP